MREPITRESEGWFIDPELGAKFFLISLADETVSVIDEFGVRRIVNRLLWDRDMQPLTGESHESSRRSGREPVSRVPVQPPRATGRARRITR
jgi:hypothetical protein